MAYDTPNPSVAAESPRSALLVIDIQESFRADPKFWAERSNPDFEHSVWIPVTTTRVATRATAGTTDTSLNHDRAARTPNRFPIAPYVHLLDLAGPVQVFDAANQEGGSYKLSFCATAPDVRSSVGLGFAGFDPLVPAAHLGPEDMLIVPGVRWKGRHPKGLLNTDFRRYLRDAYEAGAMVSSVCSGAFALGEAGLLNGRRCTTHWSLTAELQSRFPAARVLDDILYTRDERITTSAGIASGIDLSLFLVELHYGPIVTARVARISSSISGALENISNGTSSCSTDLTFIPRYTASRNG